MLVKVKGKINRLVKEGKDVYYEEKKDEYFLTRRYTLGEIMVLVRSASGNPDINEAIINVAYVNFKEYLSKEEILQIKDLLAEVYKEQEEEREKYKIKTAMQYLEEE